MMATVGTTSLEVSGFGSVRVFERYQPIDWKVLRSVPEEREYGIVFRVDDVWLLDKGSSAETEIRPETAARFYSERFAEGYRTTDFKLWWHRHPLSQGWSGTDEQCIRGTPMGNSVDPARTGWLISLVWCLDTGWNGRFDQVAKPGFTIHVPVTVEDEPALESEIQRQLHTLGVTYGSTRPSKVGNYDTPDNATAVSSNQLSMWDDEELPWYDYVQSEANNLAADLEDALLDIDWDDRHSPMALAFINEVTDEIEEYARRNRGIDQAEIEDIVTRKIGDYRMGHYRYEIMDAVRWAR
jgi:hypothetical protein